MCKNMPVWCALTFKNKLKAARTGKIQKGLAARASKAIKKSIIKELITERNSYPEHGSPGEIRTHCARVFKLYELNAQEINTVLNSLDLPPSYQQLVLASLT